jgi:hypothetical protein
VIRWALPETMGDEALSAALEAGAALDLRAAGELAHQLLAQVRAHHLGSEVGRVTTLSTPHNPERRQRGVRSPRPVGDRLLRRDNQAPLEAATTTKLFAWRPRDRRRPGCDHGVLDRGRYRALPDERTPDRLEGLVVSVVVSGKRSSTVTSEKSRCADGPQPNV